MSDLGPWTPAHIKSVGLKDGHEIVVFVWSTKHGDCYECGLPAAFASKNAFGPKRHKILCAVCAANAAADGEEIMRLNPAD